MALPTQVQAALDAAEATLAEARSQQELNTTEAAFAAADASNVETVEQATPQPQPAPVEVSPPPVPQVNEWENKYRILQGKYNAEVPELTRKVHGLENSLQAAISRLDEVSKAKEQQPVQAKAADPKDIENFGSDLVDMVQRVSNSSLEQVVRAVDGRIKQIEGALGELRNQLLGTTKTVAMTAEQTFFDRLTKLVPNWEQLNTNQAFLAWLAQVDPVYGVPRQAALDRAQKALNADHAAAVFNAFAPPAKQEAPKGPDPLEQQVSPKSAGSEPPLPENKPVISQAQVTAFYNDVRQGVYRGREAEAARIEALINTALAEGRIK